MSTMVQDFVRRVGVHFPPPKLEGADVRDWMDGIRDVLVRHDEAIVERAARLIVATRKAPKVFPLPSEIEEAIAKVIDTDRRASFVPGERKPITSDERYDARNAAWRHDRQRLAVDLVNGPMGRKAAEEGWILSLWDYCRNNGSLPREGHEVERVRRDGIEVSDLMDGLWRGTEIVRKDSDGNIVRDESGKQIFMSTDVAHALKRTADTIQVRRKKLCDWVIDGIPYEIE